MAFKRKKIKSLTGSNESFKLYGKKNDWFLIFLRGKSYMNEICLTPVESDSGSSLAQLLAQSSVLQNNHNIATALVYDN